MDARARRDAGRRPLDSLGPGKDPKLESSHTGVGHSTLIEPAAAPGASPAQIEAVYRSRYPEFLRVARAILGDVEAAHDAVQEGVARAQGPIRIPGHRAARCLGVASGRERGAHGPPPGSGASRRL